ncbi:hypothetical protein [Thermaerobacter subterraneus]|uniref:Uncharacterized protein n=1 Tax=Thermaerobacter subterraneus DSM 13965 TaxID=867903 RepID=K6Q385_9FIRM|nr:hypothetical protein [Thermaerobacter subterraneus]EKP95738.1 hypothetical protein ThesuDRAFT_01497 [Thermaerobacter subterraneus DSM 13965]
MTRFLLQPVPYVVLGILGLVALAGMVAGVTAIVTGRSSLFRLRSHAAGWLTAAVSLAVLSLAVWVGWEPHSAGRAAVFTKPRWNEGPLLSADLQAAVTPSNRGENRKVFVQQGPEDHRRSQAASTTLLVTLRADRAASREALKAAILEDCRRIMDVVFGRPEYEKWQAVSVGATYPTTRAGEQMVAAVTLTREEYRQATRDGRLDPQELAEAGTVTWLPPLAPGDTRGVGELRLGR